LNGKGPFGQNGDQKWSDYFITGAEMNGPLSGIWIFNVFDCPTSSVQLSLEYPSPNYKK
jgi:hypothetical protein